MENVNWIALIVAALSTLVIGFLWYGPLFGKAWMKETGITEEKAQKGMILRFSISVVLAFIAVFFIYANSVISGGMPPDLHGVEVTKFHTFGHGVVHGIMTALFVAMPVLVTNALFEQKSFKYILINVGYWIVTFAIMGGIVNAWV
ncbi:DUF1761 domain-containing protein [Kordia sp.]|uniref:DUF1761 domain-containing protein n=1 Tax=Kordia sp. TaxID=1965332 RepID=UPI003D6BB33D